MCILLHEYTIYQNKLQLQNILFLIFFPVDFDRWNVSLSSSALVAGLRYHSGLLKEDPRDVGVGAGGRGYEVDGRTSSVAAAGAPPRAHTPHIVASLGGGEQSQEEEESSEELHRGRWGRHWLCGPHVLC